MARIVLVRYGSIPEVSRFRVEESIGELPRGESVLIQTHRGLQLGEVLGDLRSSMQGVTSSPSDDGDEVPAGSMDDLPPVVRRAGDADREAQRQLAGESAAAFPLWRQRIADWDLDLELIDLEWTFDRRKLIVYVLNSRGPDCTKLALQAAAAGLGVVEVQPVSAEGLVAVSHHGSGSGCGTCGCH